MYKVETFIPKQSLDSIRKALLEIDAGHIGNYKGCLTVTEVVGFWYSDEGSNPAIGKTGEWSKEPELKLEFNIQENIKDKTIETLRKNHPYEEPVINVIKLQ